MTPEGLRRFPEKGLPKPQGKQTTVAWTPSPQGDACPRQRSRSAASSHILSECRGLTPPAASSPGADPYHFRCLPPPALFPSSECPSFPILPPCREPRPLRWDWAGQHVQGWLSGAGGATDAPPVLGPAAAGASLCLSLPVVM